MARKKSRQRKQKNKFGRYFLLSGKKLAYAFLAWVVSVVLHNLFYALFGTEEIVFFFIAVIIIPVYLLISFIYTLFKMSKDKTICEKEFMINAVLAIIIGIVVSYLIIKLTFLNYLAIWILVVVFSFLAYYLLKFLRRKL